MDQLKIADRYKKILHRFTQGLQDAYPGELVSLILYGSAASGEFVDKHSNLNLLAVLKAAGLEVLERSSKLARGSAMINILFLTEDYIVHSLDVFPIEFLDMRENYVVLYGKDVLKDIRIDTRNLRFQCEQELKAKLLTLRQAYVLKHDNPAELRRLLLASFTSVLHVARNVLRVKGRTPPYLKQEVIKELASELKINQGIWEKILAAKNKRIDPGKMETRQLFAGFVKDLESIVAIVDEL
ncbi:MAG: hypothetical protein WC335_05020 [Candidatus Omnitrophota bacterium]|jgi:hypothetical protein